MPYTSVSAAADRYIPWSDLSRSRRDTVASHSCHFTLCAQKPLERAFPEKLVTLGDHIKKRRLDLGLFQKDVAATIGVDTMTICNWEKGRGGRQLRFIPRIIEFLGYELPSPKPSTLGERIKQYRYLRGISQKALARKIGVDPTTLSRIERNQGRCSESVTTKASNFLKIGGALLGPE